MEELQQATACPKCLRTLTLPKLLPCLHCVCESCLTIEDGVREAEGLRYMVACPVCREETELPKSGLSSLPDAFYKVRMAESLLALRQMHEREVEVDGEPVGCQERGRGEAAEEAASSDDVVPVRLEMRPRAHALSENRFEGSTSELDHAVARLKDPVDSLEMSCPKHRLPLGVYCRSCSVLVCEQCTRDTHTEPRHKFSPVAAVARSLRGELKESVTALEERCAALDQATARASGVADALNEQRESVTATIETAFTELFQELEECRKQLLACAREEAGSRLNLLQEQIKGPRRRRGELQGLITACREMVQYSTNQEFMALRRQFTTRAKEVKFNSSVEPRDFLPLSLPLSFKAHVENCVAAHQEMHRRISMTKSTVERRQPDKPVKIGDEVCFDVCLKYRSGRTCFEREDVSVSARVPRSQSTIKVCVTRTTEIGCYVAALIPERRGQYEVSFKVGGEKPTLSPLYFTAMPQTFNWDQPTRIIADQEWPWGVACQPAGNREVYVTRNLHHQIAVIDMNGRQVKSLCHKGQNRGGLFHPTGIALNREGFLYVADGQESGRLQRLSQSGQNQCTYATPSGQRAEFLGVMVDRQDGQVYVCDRLNKRVVILTEDLKPVGTLGERGHSTGVGEFYELPEELVSPHSLAQDRDGNIYVTDPGAGCIQVFSRDGHYCKTIMHPHGGDFKPGGICIEGDTMYVADSASYCITVLHTSGEYVAQFGGSGQLEGQFYNPTCIAMDVDGYMFVCDHCNNRVQIF